MWEYTLVTTTDVSPDELWAIITDVPNRPAWNPEVVAVELDEPLQVGTDYKLWMRNGRTMRLMVEECIAPCRLVEVVRFPFAQVRTTYQFTPDGSGSVVRVAVRVSGLLGLLWRRELMRGADLATRMKRFIGQARRLVAA